MRCGPVLVVTSLVAATRACQQRGWPCEKLSDCCPDGNHVVECKKNIGESFIATCSALGALCYAGSLYVGHGPYSLLDCCWTTRCRVPPRQDSICQAPRTCGTLGTWCFPQAVNNDAACCSNLRCVMGGNGYSCQAQTSRRPSWFPSFGNRNRQRKGT